VTTAKNKGQAKKGVK